MSESRTAKLLAAAKRIRARRKQYAGSVTYEPLEEQIYTAANPGPYSMSRPRAPYLYVVRYGGTDDRTRVQKLLASGKQLAARRKQQALAKLITTDPPTS